VTSDNAVASTARWRAGTTCRDRSTGGPLPSRTPACPAVPAASAGDHAFDLANLDPLAPAG